MNATSPIINLAIMEESPLTRLGIEQFVLSLHQGIRCQVQATSVSQLWQLAPDHRIDLLISGLSGSPESVLQGIEGLIKLATFRPEIRQIVYTYSHCGEMLNSLSRLAPISLISRLETEEQTRECFMRALVGVKVCSPKIQLAIDEYTQENLAIRQRLTVSEREVLKLLFRGLSMTEAAKYLKRNIKTVSAHKRNSMQKLGVCDDADLFSLRIHFIDTDRTLVAGLWR